MSDAKDSGNPNKGEGGFAKLIARVELPWRLPRRDMSFKSPEILTNEIAVNMALGEVAYASLEDRGNAIKSEDGRNVVQWSADQSLVLIEQPENRTYRAFVRVISTLDKQTGAKIFAFQEVDASNIQGVNNIKNADLKPLSNSPIKLIFPGMGYDVIPSYEKETGLKITEGQRSPQVAFVGDYIRNSLFPDLSKANIPTPVEFEIFSHSMGAGNALHAKHLLSQNPKAKTVKAMLFEPFAAAHEAIFILKDARSSSRNLDEKAFVEQLSKNVTTIDAYPHTSIRELHLGNNVANKGFGEHFYLIDHSRWGNRAPEILAEKPSAMVERRRVQKPITPQYVTPGFEGLAVITDLIHRALLDEFADMHDVTANIQRLHKKGGASIGKYNPGSYFPALEELQFPEKHNTPTFVKSFEQGAAKSWLNR